MLSTIPSPHPTSEPAGEALLTRLKPTHYNGLVATNETTFAEGGR